MKTVGKVMIWVMDSQTSDEPSLNLSRFMHDRPIMESDNGSPDKLSPT